MVTTSTGGHTTVTNTVPRFFVDFEAKLHTVDEAHVKYLFLLMGNGSRTDAQARSICVIMYCNNGYLALPIDRPGIPEVYERRAALGRTSVSYLPGRILRGRNRTIGAESKLLHSYRMETNRAENSGGILLSPRAMRTNWKVRSFVFFACDE